MPILKQLIFASMLICALLATAAGQDSATVQSSSLTITATAIDDRVRITAPSSVVQLHVEVYGISGEKLFDQEIRGGNVFDWHLQDGQAQRLAPGDYVCVVTAKSVSGKLTQKIGTVSVAEKSVSVRAAESKQLSAPQAQTIGPVEENSSWTIAGEDKPQTPTIIAHDGMDGQMIRGRGALTFRIGNFFSGIDKEQMRLTEGGNLGIGTSEPKAKLEVAGTIRAERFLVVKPELTGVDKTAADTLTSDAVDSVQPLASGTGTQNRIAKWTDNAGTLGDSVITELAGNIGIGTATPTQALEVANGRILASGSQTITAPGGILEIGTTVTNNNNVASGIKMRNLFNGNANLQQALDVAPTFAPSASISLARGFTSAAFFAPPPGVTITEAYGGNAVTAYSNTGGAVSNGAAFTLNSPIVFGALKPTTQYGLRINNQGIGGTANSYGLFVDAQSGSTNSFSAIFAGGNVGIGTTTPEAKLDIRHEGVVDSLIITEAGNLPKVIGRTSNGTLAAPTALTNGSVLLRSSGRGHTGTGFSGDKAFIEMRAAENWTNSATGTQMNFATAPNGSNVPPSVRMTIANDGNVGINTTSPAEKLEISDGFVLSSGSNGGRFIANNPNNQSARVLLDWSNDTPRIRFGGSGLGSNNGFVIQGQGDATRLKILDSGVVSIGTLGDTTANLAVFGKIFAEDIGSGGSVQLCYNNSVGPDSHAISTCSSSLRYKTDVRSFMPGLDLLNRLRPVSFRWKGSGSADLGLVAEEVERVDPLLVTYNKQGQVEGVKYDRLGVVILNAVREQQVQIKAQQQQLRAKDERIAKLAASLAHCESILSRYESRLASLERSVAWGKRTKRQVTVRASSTGQRRLRRAAPSKAD